MLNTRKVILIGSTNYLGRALVDTFQNENYSNDIVVTGRSYARLSEYFSEDKYQSLEQILIDLDEQNDLDRLMRYLKNQDCALTVIYLAAIKSTSDDKTKRVMRIGYLRSVELFQYMEKHVKNFNYVLIGSQGDIHGTANSSSYNAAKSALSHYFEPKIFLNNLPYRIFLVKPWIFDSQTNSRSYKIQYTSNYVARKIHNGLTTGKQLIYVPVFTYKLVQLVSFLSKRLLYFVIYKIM